MNKIFLLTLFFSLRVGTSLALELDLSETELADLKAGKLILKMKEIKDQEWPDSYVYGFIEGVTPLEALAFYAAYPDQKLFVPNVIKSDPVKHASANDVHVEYEQDMPWPLSNVEYCTGNKIEKLGKDHYQISWYQVWSTSTDDSFGKAQFLLHEGKTLLSYYGRVVPQSFLAGMFKRIGPRRLRDSLEEIVKHTKIMKKENPKRLKTYVSWAEDQFKGKAVFAPVLKKASR